MKKFPLVAIVGRPNVGKSTFFNKIIGQRIAIVQDTPGVTRDRIYGGVSWCGRDFTLIDTGGIDPFSEDPLLNQMRMQAQLAIDTADLICFFCSARDGLTADDEEIAVLLRKSKKPTLVVVNQLDYTGLNTALYDFYALGFGDPIGISSTNMLGLGDLLDEITKRLPEPEAEKNGEDTQKAIQLAIVGRPNVGKSSLTNRLLGQQRVMVSDIPGTTRDAIDTLVETENGDVYNIIDTAGIRRKRSVAEESVEYYSVLRAIGAIHRCDIALLVLDATEGVTEQDTKIAGMIAEEDKGIIVVMNKWDLPEKETNTMEEMRRQVLEQLKFVDYAPVLFLSAKTGQRIQLLPEEISKVYAQAGKRVPTGALNDVIGDAQIALQPPLSAGRRLKIYYAVQTGVFPPTFTLFINSEDLMHFSYKRYLENQLRKAFGFGGTPIRFVLRERTKENS